MKNPYWAKNIDQTVERIKKARVVKESKSGSPPPPTGSFNFNIDRSFKPSFQDVQKKKGRKEIGPLQRKLLSARPDRQVSQLIGEMKDQAQVVAYKLQSKEEETKPSVI